MKQVIVKYPDELKLDKHFSRTIGKPEWEEIFLSESNSLEVSDGYHTMSELYEHRYALFYALVKIYDNYKTPLGSHVTCWKSKLHDDGSMFEGGWFIVGMMIAKLDSTRDHITYHYPIEWWDKFNIMELKNAPKWDGHTSQDVIERLMNL